MAATVSPDCTDFRILESKPFNLKWYSLKSHGPGLQFESAISTIIGEVV